jgi:hypothetical protein
MRTARMHLNLSYLATRHHRAHEALQVGSTTVHAPGLVSTVLVCKRAD